MLTTLLALAGATTAWAYHRFRSWRKRRRAADAAEIKSWKPLDRYVAEAEHPAAPTRWATPEHNRGP